MLRLFRHPGIIAGLVLLVGAGYWVLRPRVSKPIGVGYAGEGTVTLWNTMAQVRQPVADLRYGDKLEILHQEGTAVQVRAASGVTGWLVDSRQMMDAAMWQRSADLLNRARGLPVQALGHTNAISNVHIEAGRNAERIFQFSRGTRVAVLARMVVEDTGEGAAENTGGEEASGNDAHKGKAEDWLLVLREPRTALASVPATAAFSPKQTDAPSTANAVGEGPETQSTEASADGSGYSSEMPIAGWVLARFVDPDLPDTVKDHASAANMRPVAWFELNRVPDGDGGEAPQYLVAGTRGGEGQACDFTMLQVYTWSKQRMRYEIAYVESDLCGKLPIQVSRSPRGPEFRFESTGDEQGEVAYVMLDTIVRRVGGRPAGTAEKRTSADLQKHRRVHS